MRNPWVFWLCVALTLVGIAVFLGISVSHGIVGSEGFGKTCRCPETYQPLPSRIGGENVECATFTPQVNAEGKVESFTYLIIEPSCS